MSDLAPKSSTITTRFRWVICALIFGEITINYIDRFVFGFVAPELKRIFGWSSADIPDIAFWFEVAYAIGLFFMGRFLDRIGTRIGLAITLAGWCLASMAHAAVATVIGFKLARFLLGLSEAGAFPGAAKATAEWFPRRERALVAGIFNSGSNVGIILVPLAVPWLMSKYGWQWAFVITGGIGLVWLAFWLALYRLPGQHPRVSASELAYIESDPPDAIATTIPLGQLLQQRQAWSFIAGKFFTDAIWRWNLYLLPLFFSQHFGLDIKSYGPPFLLIYIMADFGSIGGGWLSSHWLKRGWSLNRARKTAMLLCVLCVTPVMMVTHVSSMWFAVFLVGLATAAHQGWSSNLYTSISDLVPSARVAHIGLYRDPETLVAVEYYFKAPTDLPERLVIAVDPMLATGNTAVAAIDRLKEHGAVDLRFVCLLATHVGLANLQEHHPGVRVWTAAIDERLNDHGYILPGLGDAGDRLYGTK